VLDEASAQAVAAVFRQDGQAGERERPAVPLRGELGRERFGDGLPPTVVRGQAVAVRVADETVVVTGDDRAEGRVFGESAQVVGVLP